MGTAACKSQGWRGAGASRSQGADLCAAALYVVQRNGRQNLAAPLQYQDSLRHLRRATPAGAGGAAFTWEFLAAAAEGKRWAMAEGGPAFSLPPARVKVARHGARVRPDRHGGMPQGLGQRKGLASTLGNVLASIRLPPYLHAWWRTHLPWRCECTACMH